MIKILSDLFFQELKDLYSAAHLMHQVLNRMSSLATNPDLVEMLDTYYFQVEYQKNNLLEFFEGCSVEIDQIETPIMIKIRDHALASMRYQGSSEIRDLALILTVNIMKHYQTTLFGALITHVNRMNREDLLGLLLTLKSKIAEDEKKPMEIASAFMQKNKSSQFKEEMKKLLASILKAQVYDEFELLRFLSDLPEQVKSVALREDLELYRLEHEVCAEKIKSFLNEFEGGSEIENWKVMGGFISDWRKDVQFAGSQDIKDIGVILSIQRIQHQNMALFQIEEVLSQFIENMEMQKQFQKLIKQEMQRDRSLTAIAEGSFFKEGLDAKVEPLL